MNRLIPGIFSLLFAGVALLAAEVVAVTDRQAAPGDVIQLSIFAQEELDGVTGTIGGDNPYCRNRAFEIRFRRQGPPGYHLYVLLLALPSTAATGIANITVDFYVSGIAERLELSILVRGRSFVREEIELDKKMSDLRRSDDDEIRLQAEELWRVLSTVDERSVYHTDRFRLPVESIRFTSYYGDRRIYRYSDGETALSLHNGIDLAGSIGTPVYATGAGRVVLSEQRIITGNTVVVENLPGMYTLYHHLDERYVRVGEIVSPGILIGGVGSTGLATGPHLHWEMRLAGVAFDPLAFIGGLSLDKAAALLQIIP